MSAVDRLPAGASAVLAGLLWAVPAGAVPILSVSPTASGIPPGGQVSIDVLVADAADLFGLQFDLLFDPSIVEFVDATRGDFLPVDLDSNGDPIHLFLALGNTDSVSVFDSRACDIESDPDCAGISGSGRVATLTFRGSHPGLSALTFGNVLFTDAFFNVLDVETQGGSIEVGQVPEPGVALLLGVGLLTAGCSARRRSHPD